MREALSNSPSLRIARVVYGKERRGNRLLYLLAASPAPGPKGIAEKVVLYRWCQRALSGYTFKGVRLPPSLWRAMVDALGKRVSTWDRLSPSEIKARVEAWRSDYQRRRARHGRTPGFEHLRLPHADAVVALIRACGASRLNKVVNRHTAATVHGVPDLFLFAVTTTGDIRAARFVEVKRPKERVSDAQRSEIDFLVSIGLKARVLQLIEADRDRIPRAAPAGTR